MNAKPKKEAVREIISCLTGWAIVCRKDEETGETVCTTLSDDDENITIHNMLDTCNCLMLEYEKYTNLADFRASWTFETKDTEAIIKELEAIRKAIN